MEIGNITGAAPAGQQDAPAAATIRDLRAPLGVLIRQGHALLERLRHQPIPCDVALRESAERTLMAAARVDTLLGQLAAAAEHASLDAMLPGSDTRK